SANRPQRASERELSREFVRRERGRGNLARRREYADCDRQIEAAGFLRQVGRREIHRDLASGKLELRILQRRAYALARFLDLGVRKTHQIECRQPAGKMTLDSDRCGLQACEGARVDNRQRHRCLAGNAIGSKSRRGAPGDYSVLLGGSRFSISARRASSASSFSRVLSNTCAWTSTS